MTQLERFIAAQNGCYAEALAELNAGAKTGHWMWFMFPQIAGLGRSETARYYALADLAEAREYLAHRLLRCRLEECTVALLGWAGRREAQAILGTIDALKLRSSMTLFEAAGGNEVFVKVLDAFYDGQRDAATLRILQER